MAKYRYTDKQETNEHGQTLGFAVWMGGPSLTYVAGVAHYTFAYLFHGGQGCPIYAKFAQLNRLRFSPGLGSNVGNPAYLDDNAKEIYRQLVVNHYGLHSTNPLNHA
jgi:hypothetical protein